MISLPSVVFGEELGDVLVRSQARLRLGVRHLFEKVDGNSGAKVLHFHASDLLFMIRFRADIVRVFALRPS